VWSRIAGKRGTVDVIFDLKGAAGASARKQTVDLPKISHVMG
jgi:hypothetical protein